MQRVDYRHTAIGARSCSPDEVVAGITQTRPVEGPRCFSQTYRPGRDGLRSHTIGSPTLIN